MSICPFLTPTLPISSAHLHYESKASISSSPPSPSSQSTLTPILPVFFNLNNLTTVKIPSVALNPFVKPSLLSSAEGLSITLATMTALTVGPTKSPI